MTYIYIIKFIFRQFNGCVFLLIFFSVYKLISRPPNQIIPLITKSFKKKTPLAVAAITTLVIGPFFLGNKQLKKKKKLSRKKINKRSSSRVCVTGYQLKPRNEFRRKPPF